MYPPLPLIMTSTRLPKQSNPPLSPRLTLPTMYDLPSEAIENYGTSLLKMGIAVSFVSKLANT